MRLTEEEYRNLLRKNPSLRPDADLVKIKEAVEREVKKGEKLGWDIAKVRKDMGIETTNAALQPLAAQIRPSKDEDKLNKTERAWLSVLRLRNPKFLGIQSITFKLGDDCRYTPDFVEVSQEDKFIAWEVKGFMRDDALVKIKVASRMYSFLEFYLVKRIAGNWETTKVGP